MFRIRLPHRKLFPKKSKNCFDLKCRQFPWSFFSGSTQFHLPFPFPLWHCHFYRFPSPRLNTKFSTSASVLLAFNGFLMGSHALYTYCPLCSTLPMCLLISLSSVFRSTIHTVQVHPYTRPPNFPSSSCIILLNM